MKIEVEISKVIRYRMKITYRESVSPKTKFK